VPLLGDQRLALNMLALVLWWIGAFMISFGTRAFRRALFPLFFLFWMVPIPEFILNPIVGLLQEGSVASGARSLRDHRRSLSSRRNTNDDSGVDHRSCPGSAAVSVPV